ncbi:MAG: four helix bundle protein [Pirellulaceae bacterium]
MCSYRELPLWQRALDLAEVIHRSTRDFPLAERLGLTMQLRRLAVAIPLHVAGHYSRRASTFLRGLRRAHRALRQLEHQVLIAGRLQYWSAEQAEEISQGVAEVRRHLQAFFNSLRPPSEC